MTWKFHVHATEQRRLFSRILQILESQMVSIRSFAGEASSGGVRITFVVSSEEDRAYRIEALLHRLEDVRSVSIQDTAG
jgi:acetolactate synthase regulatory subunit